VANCFLQCQLFVAVQKNFDGGKLKNVVKPAVSWSGERDPTHEYADLACVAMVAPDALDRSRPRLIRAASGRWDRLLLTIRGHG
jgi:hypothetical protein